MTETYNDRPQSGWSDTKLITNRRLKNFEKNLRKHIRKQNFINLNHPDAWEAQLHVQHRDENRNKQEESEEEEEKEESLLLPSQNPEKSTVLSWHPMSISNESLSLSRYSLRMEILGAFALGMVVFLILMVLTYNLDGEDLNGSLCYHKFKELGCSMLRPSEECKQYLECLQKYGKHNENDEKVDFRYYFGAFMGLLGWYIKRYIAKVML